jgi:hypothetical protein
VAPKGNKNPNKPLDEKREAPHNLISLLLTNKTICWRAGNLMAGS